MYLAYKYYLFSGIFFMTVYAVFSFYENNVLCEAYKPILVYIIWRYTMTTDIEMEAKINAKGLNAPRLSPDLINATIVDVKYWNPEGTTLTVCALTLTNGTNVVGESACVSPDNFDLEIGKEIAFNNAKSKIWQLEGYLLKEALYKKAAGSYQGGN
jgi:hypothetical protein